MVLFSSYWNKELLFVLDIVPPGQNKLKGTGVSGYVKTYSRSIFFLHPNNCKCSHWISSVMSFSHFLDFCFHVLGTFIRSEM